MRPRKSRKDAMKQLRDLINPTLYKLTDEEVARLNGPDQANFRNYIFRNGKMFVHDIDDEDWLLLGVAPVPKTRLEIFVYHFCHGLLMHYPIIKVLLFSIISSLDRQKPESAVFEGSEDWGDNWYAGRCNYTRWYSKKLHTGKPLPKES
jgi:hypothetical protein